MLIWWLGLTTVNISGYMPLAEQTWVALDPAWYPLSHPLPELFVAWHGNQYPVLERERRHGRWQVLFPARLKPPFALFEGSPTLSKVYLARLKRIDELAYGISSTQAVREVGTSMGGTVASVASAYGEVVPAWAGIAISHELAGRRLPWLVESGVRWPPVSDLPRVSPPSVTSTPVQGLATEPGACHKVGSGETLWRIASKLARDRNGNTYVYMLALHDENRARLGKRGQVISGSTLRCPSEAILARYGAMEQEERQALLATIER